MRALLEEEARVWNARLLWDYAPSVQLLIQYLDARILPGLVAVERASGEVLGYCFSVYEGQKAVVGDVFAWPQGGAGHTATEIEEMLLRPLLETLQHTPGIARIESQLLLHDSNRLAKVFREADSTMHRRLFMQSALDVPSALLLGKDEVLHGMPAHVRMMRWMTPHFQAAGELIHRAYANHGDSAINDQYHSVHGSLRFLHNIVRFPGCGVFDAEASWVLWDDNTQEMDGVLLCSTVERKVAHVTQLCVAPRRRGHGLGRALLRHAATELSRRGFKILTLTVTEENTAAMHLYQSLGFTQRANFDAMVWVKRR